MKVAAVRRWKYVRPLALFLIALLMRPSIAIANDVTPPAAPPARPAIVGFIDTHLHQFANLGFGGLELWGSPMDPTKDPNADIEVARARALPSSDFIYVPEAEAGDYVGVAGVAVSGPSIPCPDGSGPCVKLTLHGPNGGNDLLNKVIPNGSESHGTLGYPIMDGWPAFDVLTVQQAYWEWLERAHQNGMKLMVMLAVNNSVLCQLALHRTSFGCGDDGAVARQIQGAKDLEAYIDAKAGGPGQGFYRIVYSAAEARAAIYAGKMAVVLGTEVDTKWGCTVGSAGCTEGYVADRVQEYYDAGVRVVYPVHLIDNKFGGAAVYTGIFELNNLLVNGSFFTMAGCDAPYEWRSDIRKIIDDAKIGVTAAMAGMVLSGGALFPVLDLIIAGLFLAAPLFAWFMPVVGLFFAGALAPFLALPGLGSAVLVFAAGFLIWQLPGSVGDAAQGNCNTRGLTAEGETLINALIDREMLIDIDHTDTHTFNAIMNIAESRHYPGIVSGHTGLVGASKTRAEAGEGFDPSHSGRHEGNKTDEAVGRILDAGGFVSLGIFGGHRDALRDYSSTDAVAFDCGRSSQGFAQNYLYATKHLGMTAVGLGSDINGFAGYVAPRYGAKACGGEMAPGYEPNRPDGRLDYANATVYGDVSLTQYTFGNRTWDFNVDGFANVGLFPDFLADLKAIGLTDAELAPIFNGVEAYVRMWEKANDSEAPEVRCGTVGEEWHAQDVSVPCLSFDVGWGLGNTDDADFSLSTSVANGTETDAASTGTHAAVCDTDHNCSSTIAAITGINVDKKDPSVVVSTPAAGTPTYLLNEVVNASYNCTDGGSGVKTCSAPVASGAAIDTTLGAHAFTVTGIDNVDHTVLVPRPYNVTFKICVLYDETKVHKAGSTVPVKLAICDAANNNVSTASVVLTATGVTQLSTSAAGAVEDAGNANPDNNFRFDASLNGYIFNLKTAGMTTGTYALTFTATGDPIPHQVKFQVR